MTLIAGPLAFIWVFDVTISTKAIDTHMVEDHIFVFGPLVACLIEGRVHGCKYSQLISQILVWQWVVWEQIEELKIRLK